jgi:hypothetical protein
VGEVYGSEMSDKMTIREAKDLKNLRQTEAADLKRLSLLEEHAKVQARVSSNPHERRVWQEIADHWQSQITAQAKSDEDVAADAA